MDLKASLVKKNSPNEKPFNVDKITTAFISAYNGLCLAPDCILYMDFEATILRLVVVSLKKVELGDERRVGEMDMGILMEKTDVNIFKAEDSLLKLKASRKKYASNSFAVNN